MNNKYPKLSCADKINCKFPLDEKQLMIALYDLGLKKIFIAKIFKINYFYLRKILDPEEMKKSTDYNKIWLRRKKKDPEFRQQHDLNMRKHFKRRIENDLEFKRYTNRMSVIFSSTPERKARKAEYDKKYVSKEN